MSERKPMLATRLHSAAIHLLRAVWVEDRATGLSRARLSVLSVLVFGGPRSLKQLTGIEQVAAPTMTKLVAGLERAGYVRRQGDPADGRSWLIHATAKAARVMSKGRERRVALLLDLLADASPADWAAIEHVVEVIERAVRRPVLEDA